MSSVIFQIQSFLVVGLMLYGVSKRRKKYLHMRIMKVAIIWDLLLVAQIELTRGAIATASKVFANPLILNIHVSLAVSTVVLYLLVYLCGRKLNNGEEDIRKWHKLLGCLTLLTRISTLVTSNLIGTH